MGAVDGFVLAGGRGRRMGVDKARIPFPERRPMALFVAGLLQPVCGRVALVRRSVPDPLPWPEGTRVVLDGAPAGDAHPLWGVAAALEAARTEWAVVVPCDRPWLTEQALRTLLDAAGKRGAVAVGSGGVHPLTAVLPRSRAAEASQAAAAGASARSFVADCVPVPLDDAVLADLDRWEDAGRPGPIRALLDGLHELDPAARERIARGERARLAARGMVDPEVG